MVELSDVLRERLNAAERDLARRHLKTADHRDGDVAEVADEHRERRYQPRKELRPKAGVIDVGVELVELLQSPRPVADSRPSEPSSEIGLPVTIAGV